MEDFIMDNGNMAMEKRAFSMGNKMLRLMKKSHTGIKDLARHFGIYK